MRFFSGEKKKMEKPSLGFEFNEPSYVCVALINFGTYYYWSGRSFVYRKVRDSHKNKNKQIRTQAEQQPNPTNPKTHKHTHV